jgi:UDP-glucose 4-epimerase
MTATRRPEARHEAAEQDAIRRIVARMLEQFPELPATEIERSVYGSYDTLDDSAVRDFIPVLERATRRHLSEHSYRRHRA